jgi:serine/threonine protein kinase
VVGGYRIDGLISRGGMGIVYRATNLALDRMYALKVIAPELASDVIFRERFKREIRIAASLHHPNVVPIHYAGEQDGMLFLAMDFVEGIDLKEMIKRDGALAPDRAVAILTQVTSALDAAHKKGLVHRDVKPANILISEEHGHDHAYLTDFGVAKRFDNPTDLTVKGAVVGTVDYMPPEQITGAEADARTDIYALGCVFFQMLTGEVPFERDNSVATLFAHVYEAPPSLVGPVAATHPTLGPVIAKAMAKRPEDRYLSAGDLCRDADMALQGMRFTGPPTSVATGDAMPTLNADEPASERALAALQDMQAAIAGPQAGQVTRKRRVVSDTDPAAEPAPVPIAHAAATEPSAPEPGPVLGGTPAPSPAPPPGPPPAATPTRRKPKPWGLIAIGVGALVVCAIVIVVVVSGGSSSSNSGAQPFASTLAPIPDNRVTGAGTATVELKGNVATVTLDYHGLLKGAVHLLHIHAGGMGVCPPASAATLHNGHLSISTTQGANWYGAPVVSLTTVGDTSPKSIIDFTRYPVGGTVHYHRTISIPSSVVTDIRNNNAVMIVHGIDYNGNGTYDNYLGASDLSNKLTDESTDPALCGPLAANTKAADGAVVLTATLAPNTYLSTPGAMADMPCIAPTRRRSGFAIA